MNKDRRKKIADVISKFEHVKEMLEDILYEEQDYYDNIPENLLGSERAENSEEAIDVMQEAVENIEEAINNLNEVI